jgi:hypothetical protein
MNVSDRYHLRFFILNDHCAVDANLQNSILAQFLTIWSDPEEIVNTLIPLINHGIKYGEQARFLKNKDDPGLEEKMKIRWQESNDQGLRTFVNIEEYWQRISEYSGYYIEEHESFLEGIDGDVAGVAFVTSEKTTIEASDLGHSDMELPSIDFKGIVIEWLTFILKNREVLLS